MSYIRINLKADIRRRTSAVITVVLFSMIMAGVCAAAILLERPTVSETEKRTLAARPEFSIESYLDGSFADQLDKYFTDTVPFRDTLNEMAAVLESAKGIPAPQFYGVQIVNDEILAAEKEEITEQIKVVKPAAETRGFASATEGYSPAQPQQPMPAADNIPAAAENAETLPAETMPVLAEAEEEGEFVGDINDFLNNGILVNGVDMYGEKAGIMLFGGNDKQGKRYADIISAYKRELGDEINVYNLIVPTSVEFYLPKKFKRYSNSEKAEIDYIYSNLTDGVIPVDAYSVLAEHKNEYIYFRTDHHWSDLGAYYAYTAFCDAIGQTPPSLDSYDKITKDEPYVGSLYGYTGDVTLKNNPDTFTYYKTRSEFTGETFHYDTLRSAGKNVIYHEYASGSGMYGMFLGSDGIHVKITTSAGTGRKIVMFKESYGNAFAPFLIDSFDEIYIIDIRYFGANAVDYIKKVGATDVLFMDNVFAANTRILIDGIERMLTSPTGTIVYAPAVTEAPQTAASAGTASPRVTTLHADTGKPVEKGETAQKVTVPKAGNEETAQTEQSQQTKQTKQTKKTVKKPIHSIEPSRFFGAVFLSAKNF